ncbi:MerR family transcriptional regulator [Vallitalea okinawensis]|uniref:MerR family transcriptional regulator n=1 Tax=Vallitalea okinawensis TaxID=2078660 RepID=UPI000CFB466E|nr:MerR family transcriptional regulator [Vallitalea okinawensis]
MPNDKRYTINQVAQLFQITTNKLRFYEKKGLIKAIRDKQNNYRYYSDKHLIKIQAILMYRVLGFSIEDIQTVLNKDYRDGFLNLFYNQWKMVNDEMHHLRLLQGSLEKIMDAMYEGDEYNTMDRIIESCKRINEVQAIKNNWEDRWNFDHWSKTYDTSVKNNVGELGIYEHYEEVLENVYQLATKDIHETPNHIKVLDIGVGTGNLSEKFLSNNYDIVGIDQSREMLNVAKKKFPKLPVRLGEFLKIPFDNNQFDIIVTTYAFHHLNDSEKSIAIEEMLRVLKDKGVIVIGDMMFENEGQKQEMLSQLSVQQRAEIEDEYYTNIELLRQVIEEHGMKLRYEPIDYINYLVKISI